MARRGRTDEQRRGEEADERGREVHQRSPKFVPMRVSAFETIPKHSAKERCRRARATSAGGVATRTAHATPHATTVIAPR
jgi:hypothetical protein